MSTEEKSYSNSQSSESGSHHHHHHSSSSSKKHKHRHSDDSDRFKRHGLTAIRRRKLFAKWFKIALEIIAVLVVLAYIYVYMNT